ncbi:MAG: pitrilysin family protein [Candidatus Zixiibacteriota bacterium]
MRKCFVSAVLITVLMLVFSISTATAQNIDAKEYRLDNGMQVLMVERHESPTIMASIFAKVGSANEITGITGISHLFEHMMFKGTETIGTKDIVRDREIMAQLDSLRALMRTEERIMREQLRRGEIDDLYDPVSKTPRYREIEKVFDSLILEQRQLIIKDQLDELYSKNGGFFLNAFTSEDMTGYLVRLPKNKIELYMWLESDRFNNPVFREFYSERDVVREERRLGVESTPTGLIEEDFLSMFWKSSSYHWDVIGWPSDLGSITRAQADQYFETYYAPNNLVMILVGDLEPDKMIKMVKEYFERIPRGKVDPPDVTTLEEKQYGEKRLLAEAESSPKAEIWYHTVAWKHPDSYPLEVLAGIMSGKTGRLYKKLVDEKGIAKSSGGGGGRMMPGDDLAVGANQDSRKYAGAFQMSAEAVSGVRAEQLEEAMYEMIEDLKTNPVAEEELQKVKNQLMVQKIRFMDIMSGIGILFYLGQNAAYGDWTEANNGLKKMELVTADDIMRVANKYFADDQRNVLIINSKETAGGQEMQEAGEDDQFNQKVTMINSMTDATKLQQMIAMVSMQLDKIEDPKEKEMTEKLLGVANKKLAELKAAEGN